MALEGVGTLCSVESGIQTPSHARSPSPSHGKVEKGNPKAPPIAAAHPFWEVGGGAWSWWLRRRPSKGHYWPQHGLYMTTTRPQLAKRQIGILAFLLKISCLSFF
jgi:hypothetical protein